MSAGEPVHLVVPSGLDRQRADKVLASGLPQFSRTAIQRAFDAGGVRAGGQVIPRDHPVSAGDLLELSMPPTRPSEIRAVEIPLEILYEDESLVAINKQSGMVVHPAAGTGEDTLVHALLAHCGKELSGIGGVERPGIVHRLDRETSGVLIAAKSDAAHRGLAALFAARTLVKEYLALVSGVPSLLSGLIDRPIGRHQTHRHKMTVDEEKGKPARTDWEVLERFGRAYALLRCRIHTGRTHQIRVHLKALGHSIVGDAVYGFRPDARLPVPPGRVMLHAEHLALAHPVTGAPLDLRAPVPEDLSAQLTQLRQLFGSQPVAKVVGRMQVPR